ncbi:hypothetical protein PHET_01320 [Paragonimus heterotremus]|uniref:Uncharacterized protein n=1 Tax=Paragonimus heterotremus TaxID=100268 RepID=A0A8J4TMF8_9TREM|nr:hypothetical protein PHET_01320 [Paragonimus heterotremus]
MIRETVTHYLTNGEDLQTLRQTLPHVDFETGLKNRTVKRDPITGLGVTSKANGVTDKTRQRTQSVGRRVYNPTLISWDADSPVSQRASTSTRSAQNPIRNPIALTGELGLEVDTLRTTSRPRTGTPREPQRDPIAGKGDFGEKEWDPVWKYNGRIRRSKSSNGIRSNPLTGENMKTFDVMVEEKTHDKQQQQKITGLMKNIFTGENCSTYTVSPGMKSPSKKSQTGSPRNTITGENCTTYDINSEVKEPKTRTVTKTSNPVSGENVTTFMVSQEERQRPIKPYVYRNTLTGENVPSYTITPIERSVTPRALKERQNPISGDHLKTYIYRVGEGNVATRKRDLSSPLTGNGCRGRTYTVSVEERHAEGGGENSGSGGRMRARSQGPTRNVLTGENCQTYLICQEMRSERPSSCTSGGLLGRTTTYNILTGA